MLIWIKEILMQILIWILGFIDVIFDVFRAIAGLDTVNTGNSEEQSIGEYFLGLDGVQQAFWIVFIASLGICAVCTVVAIIKNIINAKGGETKSHVKTLGQSMSTVIVSLVMATILVVGMGCADKLLSAVDKSINYGDKTIMSHEIVNIAVSDSFLFDKENLQGLNKTDEETGDVIYVSYLYYFEADGDGKPKKYDENPNCYIWTDETGEHIPLDDAYTGIFDEFDNPVLDAAGYPRVELNLDKLVPRRSSGGWLIKGDMKDFNSSSDDGFYSKDDLAVNFWDERVSHILGDHNSFLIPTSWKYDGLVDPDSFNFLIAYICAIVILIAIISAMFGLVKRLYDIVLLFISLPGIAATIPLDDGAKFKLWRETVISKVFLAFGTVLAVNIFTIVAPQIWSISMDASNFVNSELRLVLICGGALSISGGQLLFARLLGTSAEESREMAQSARTLFGGAMTGFGAAKAAGRGLFGYRNANGQRVGGLIKGGAGLAGTLGGGAANALGGLVGGQAYRSSAVGRGVSATQKALKGFGGSSGWFGKDKSTGENTLGGTIGSGFGKLGGKFTNSRIGQNTGLNNGVVGGITMAKREHEARLRADDIAVAFGVSPTDVKHVPYGEQASRKKKE